jgi:AcrR family transcriptional regulator
MARARLSPETLLKISLKCAQAFHEHGGDAPTRVLVAESGLSERTFFRYFPTKAESLRPFLDAGNRRFAEALARRLEGGSSDHLDAVAEAFGEAAEAGELDWGNHLMQLVLTVPALRRVWLEANEDLPALLWPAFARSLGRPEDHDETLMAADEAVLVAVCAVRVMARRGEGPREAVERVAVAFRKDPLARPVGTP